MFPEHEVAEYAERSLRIHSFAVQKAALQDFLLARADGVEDGHIGQIAISPREVNAAGNRNYLLAFADDDADESGRGAFRFVELESLEESLQSQDLGAGDLQDTALLSFASRPRDTTSLLGGFSFSRRGGGDQHLRELSIVAAENGYSVTFRDDNPSDDGYSASVNALLVPNANIAGRHVQSFENAVGSIDVAREPGQAALCGFSFKYADSDHHLRHLEVKLSGDRIRLAMRDNDRNRAFHATIEYAILQD